MDLVTADYLAHATQLWSALSDDLQALRSTHGAAQRKLLARIFRHAHSFKGLVQTAGLTQTGRLAHELENILDQLRTGQRVADAALHSVLEKNCEALGRGIAAAEEITWEQLPEETGPLSAAPAPLESWGRKLAPHEAHRVHAAVAEGLCVMAVTVSLAWATFDEDLRALSRQLETDGEVIVSEPLLPDTSGRMAFRLLYATNAIGPDLAKIIAPFGPFSWNPLLRQEILERVAQAGTRAAHATGREVVITSAAVTPLPDTLFDALLQIVRNAVVHGIEPPAERRAAGKPLPGRIHLAIWTEAGQTVVRISDDGRGLNPDNPVPAIFQSGFSTATEVTEWAGRGVGLDIVKHTLDELGGRVEVVSKVGQGTSFTLFVGR